MGHQTTGKTASEDSRTTQNKGLARDRITKEQHQMIEKQHHTKKGQD